MGVGIVTDLLLVVNCPGGPGFRSGQGLARSTPLCYGDLFLVWMCFVSESPESLAPLVFEAVDDLTSVDVLLPPGLGPPCEHELGPWDNHARSATQSMLLEVANALACCVQGLEGDEVESRRRLRRACWNPWARWYLSALSEGLSVEAVYVRPPASPEALALANARLKRWVCLPAFASI